MTKFIWEKKLAADGSEGGNCDAVGQADRSVHCVNNRYTWSHTGTAGDGTLFTEFLAELNDVAGGGMNCFAGYCDWCIPNVKRLQSIVDYSMFSPASSVPGGTAAALYWSSTPFNDGTFDGTFVAWVILFDTGRVDKAVKQDSFHARAVRPCP